MKVLFIEEAKLEFEDSVLFYEVEQENLGQLFKHEVKRFIDIIINYPDIGKDEGYDLKSLLLHKFPYKIIYHIIDETIVILALAHQHRKPAYWAKRKK